MVTILTAQNVLDWTGYTTEDCSLVITENLVDLSIADVNSDASQSITKMAGVAGVKTVSLTDPQIKAVMAMVTMRINTKLYHGKSGGLGSASASLMAEDPQNRLCRAEYDAAIQNILFPPRILVRDFKRV